MVCSSPFPLLRSILGICFRPTIQYRTVFSAPILLPELASLQHGDAGQSSALLFSFAAGPRSAPAKYHPSTLHIYVLLPIFQQVVLACVKSIFFTSFGQTYLMCTCTCPSNVKVPLWPLNAQITGFTQNSSHLSPCLNLKDMLSPCFILLCVPFTSPNSFYPSLRGHSSKLLFYFKTIHFQEQGEKGRLLLACCCCHLSSQVQPFCGPAFLELTLSNCFL